MANYLLRSPQSDERLEFCLDGGGTVGAFDSAARKELCLDLAVDALSAFERSSAEKESLRGIAEREAGSGIVSILLSDVVWFIGLYVVEIWLL